MTLQTELTRRLQILHPILQAPFAGGGDTPALVAAVSEAGALGCIGAAYLTPEQILAVTQEVRARTTRPFGINLFAPQAAPAMPADPGPALRRVTAYLLELGLPPPAPPAWKGDAFPAQMEAVLESGASLFSFTLGIVPAEALRAARALGMLVAGTATTVGEALALEHAGVDAVVCQGAEAGGHRATFSVPAEAGLVGTIALVPQAADAVRVPVIASGGIMDGRGIAAALALGAAAVQVGTAFLTCEEAGVPEVYKQTILAAHEHETGLTRAFSGRMARGIVNRFMRDLDAEGSGAILPFPLQNALTRPLRTAAAQRGRAEFLSLWAGQGVRMARRQPAAQLVARLAEELEAVARRMGSAV